MHEQRSRRDVEFGGVSPRHASTETVMHAGCVGSALWWAAAIAVAWLLVLTGMVRGGTIYVDDRLGDDRYDGSSPEPLSEFIGPVQTLRAAIHRAGPGDIIELANGGATYYASITLFGGRHSGVAGRPFEIRGNGATLSGAKPITPGTWQHVGNNVWRITPMRKRYYQLVRNGEAVPEMQTEAGADSLPDLPIGSWTVWRSALYYRPESTVNPNLIELWLADEEAGITLLDVQNVVIRDLTLKHYRLDGINAHDRCRNVELVNVTLSENGRAGLTVAGTSEVRVRESRLERNREASLLILELGEAEMVSSQYDAAPVVVPFGE